MTHVFLILYLHVMNFTQCFSVYKMSIFFLEYHLLCCPLCNAGFHQKYFPEGHLWAKLDGN